MNCINAFLCTYIYDCLLAKCADDKTLVGLVSEDDDTAFVGQLCEVDYI